MLGLLGALMGRDGLQHSRFPLHQHTDRGKQSGMFQDFAKRSGAFVRIEKTAGERIGIAGGICGKLDFAGANGSFIRSPDAIERPGVDQTPNNNVTVGRPFSALRCLAAA